MYKETKEIVKNTFYLYLVQGLNYLLPLLVLPYLIKTLSVESFGIFSFAFAFSQFILLFVDFGFNISATKKIAENNSNSFFIKDVFWIVISLKAILCIISLLITVIIILVIPKISIYADAIIWSFLMVVGTVFFPVWWFQGMNKMREMSLINAASKILSYPMIFLFVKKSNDYNIAIIIQSLSFVYASLFALLYIWRTHNFYFYKKRFFYPKQTYFNEMRDSVGIFLSNSSISLYTNSLTIFLGIFSNNYNVGLFGAMERIVRVICFGVLGPINQACFPVIIQMKKFNFSKAKLTFRYIILVTLILMTLAYLIYYLFQSWLINRFFIDYTGIEGMLNVFMLMIFPIALGGILGNLGLLGLGGDREKRVFSKVYIWVGFISVPVSIFAIKCFELKGAIIAMLFVEFTIFILMLVINLKRRFI